MTVGQALTLVCLAAVAAVSAATPPAAATDEPSPTFVPVTSAERRTTRPLARAVVAAYRSGRFSAICDMSALAEIRRVYGSLRRCRRALERVTAPSPRCVFRVGLVLGVYDTPRRQARHRKTLVWLYVMRSPMRRGHGELEISFRKEGGRWVLLPDFVEAWSG